MKILGFILSIISLTEGGLLRSTEDFLSKVGKKQSANRNLVKLRTNYRAISRDLLNRGKINNFRRKLDPFWY